MLGFALPGKELAATFARLGVASGIALIEQEGFAGALEAVITNAAEAGITIFQLFEDMRKVQGAVGLEQFEDFVDVLSGVAVLLMLEVYRAGEDPIPGADARALCRSIRKRGRVEPVFVDDPAKLADILATQLQDGDLLVTQGAGNVGAIAKELAGASNPSFSKTSTKVRSM